MIEINKEALAIVKAFSIFGLLFLLLGCQTNCSKMEPTIICPVQIERFSEMPSSFAELSNEEREQEWGKELVLGYAFAKEWDLYRAITCYKRALILLPECDIDRRLQLEYSLIQCYYLGNKYQEALTLFERSELSQAQASFPAFKNLLLIIYDCYLSTDQDEKASCVLNAIQLYSDETFTDLELYEALKKGEVDQARCLVENHCHLESLQKDFAFYDQFAKSPRKARVLNAILPGAGYYYVGEKKSAVTSFIINTLFTAAAYQFFHRGYVAAGAITTSLELGWYLGGINGAGIEAQQFNTRLFEGVSRRMLLKNDGFPVLMFETSF